MRISLNKGCGYRSFSQQYLRKLWVESGRRQPLSLGQVMDEPAVQAKLNVEQTLGEQIASKIVRFKDLTRCGDEVWIEHRGQLYRLRETRQGKLIMTK